MSNTFNKENRLNSVFNNHKYVITLVIFLVWIVFIDNGSVLVILDLNSEINRYEQQLEKNNNFYNKLMKNKEEKERFARENYFMKKSNEDIFILVSDSTNMKK